MKKYQELKKNSRRSLKYHLFYSIIVCFLTSTILNFSYRTDNYGIVNYFLEIVNLKCRLKCRLEQYDRHFLWEDYWTGGFDIMKM